MRLIALAAAAIALCATLPAPDARASSTPGDRCQAARSAIEVAGGKLPAAVQDIVNAYRTEASLLRVQASYHRAVTSLIASLPTKKTDRERDDVRVRIAQYDRKIALLDALIADARTQRAEGLAAYRAVFPPIEDVLEAVSADGQTDAVSLWECSDATRFHLRQAVGAFQTSLARFQKQWSDAHGELLEASSALNDAQYARAQIERPAGPDPSE